MSNSRRLLIILAAFGCSVLLVWRARHDAPRSLRVEWLDKAWQPWGGPNEFVRAFTVSNEGPDNLLYEYIPPGEDIPDYKAHTGVGTPLGPGDGNAIHVLVSSLPPPRAVPRIAVFRDDLDDRLAFRERYPLLRWLRPLPQEIIELPY